RTHALLRPDVALAAAGEMEPPLDKTEIDGLVEMIREAPSADCAAAAIRALDSVDSPVVVTALERAAQAPWSAIRVIAIRALAERASADCETFASDLLHKILRTDGAWIVRRAALQALSRETTTDRWNILAADDDPHWRVRHALINVLLDGGQGDSDRREILDHLSQRTGDPRTHGVRRFLQYRWNMEPRDAKEANNRDEAEEANKIDEPKSATSGHPLESFPWWDWDPAVLVRGLETTPESRRKNLLPCMPRLIQHSHERARRFAGELLSRMGEPEHLAETLRTLDEPRLGADDDVEKLFQSLNLDRKEDVALLILRSADPSPSQLAWAIDQAG
ncbi:MAG: HEAT repeat domain-containing protein, partial [Planctomycetales bacterium]